MQPRISLVTLGVADLAASRAFYERLGWRTSSVGGDEVAFFHTGGAILGLYPRHLLAGDAGLSDSPVAAFSGVTLAHNVPDKADVAAVLAQAEAAGARILKPAQDVFWGGHHGYFADRDGHVWEVAWNPGFPLDADGNVQLPD
jgi:catechol 2,3-dioxygenase-like lactoylglutathione lyase family enzyme